MKYILHGLHNRFRIGFQHTAPLRSATSNMPSAREHPDVMQHYIGDELTKGCLLGPYAAGHIQSLHINYFGVIPKGRNTGKWRLITDLSFPEGASINDGIDPSLCSLKYTTVEKVARIIVGLGTAALLAKVDIEEAYRLIPVHP